MQYRWTVIKCFLSYLVVKTFGASVQSINVADGTPLQGQSCMIACQVEDSVATSVYIYKTPVEVESLWDVSYIAFCSSHCISIDSGYVANWSSGSLTLTINHLNRTKDERWWACSVEASSKSFYLTVFTEPTGVSLESTECDLAFSPCIFICRTSCTYPKPTFTWRYSDGSDDDGLFARVNKRDSNETNGCTDWEGHVSETITIPQYTTFSDNSDNTRNLKCQVKFHLSDKYLETDISSNLRFAVNVKKVSLYDGTKILKTNDKLAVLDNANKSLSCISSPTQARPLPTIKLHIRRDTIIIASATVVSFQVKETYHGANVCCESINSLQPVYSEAVQLYVQVKIKSVVILPANISIIKAILEIAEPMTCVASGGRPGSSIKWYKKDKNGDLKQIGENINVRNSTTSNSFVTTENIYRLKASLSDNGCEYYCSGQNVHEMNPLKSEPKTLEVQYPPTGMTVTDKNNNKVGTTVDTIRGKNVQLLCSANSNPPVDQYLWNIDGKRKRTLTIYNIQNSVTANCTAKNYMSSTSGIAMSGINWHAIRINVQYGASITNLMLIVDGITRESNTVIVEQNSSISIVCDIDSNPGSTIKLLKASEVLEERPDSLNLVYIIASAACSDISDYTCQASNGVEDGTQPDKRKVQLYVRCSPILAEETDTTMFALQNRSTTLSVTVIAFPMPTHYNWFKKTSNGWQEVTNSSDIEITHTSLQFNLTIRRVREEYYGIYNLTVGNGIGHPSGFLLLLQAQEEPKRQSDAPDNGSMGDIIGGVIGGLLVAGLLIAVLCLLRKRNWFDDMKTNLFGSKSKISRDVTASKIDEGTAYENLMILTGTSTTANPAKKEKALNVKETNLTSQSYVGLKDADIVFSDNTASPCKKKKKNNGGHTKSKRNASKMEGEYENGEECRAEPVEYEELGGTRGQSHMYETVQQDRVRAQDSEYEGIDSSQRQDHTYESVH